MAVILQRKRRRCEMCEAYPPVEPARPVASARIPQRAGDCAAAAASAEEEGRRLSSGVQGEAAENSPSTSGGGCSQTSAEWEG